MGETVDVKLGADVVGVTGRVNGAEAVWQYAGGGLWTAGVGRSETGAYLISVTCWDELGRSTDFETELTYGFAAVTDRGPGAYYNASDLNRVGQAVRFLADLLRANGYIVTVQPRTDWTREVFPTERDMKIYLNNVKALIDAYCTLSTTPDLPEDMEDLTWEEANAIEQILVDLHRLLENMSSAWVYSGEGYTGEE